MANKMRDVAKERFWRGVLKKFAAGGLSVRAFCRQERLSEPSFYAWRRCGRAGPQQVGRCRSNVGPRPSNWPFCR